MVAIVSVSFASCGDDDDDNSNKNEKTTSSIIGTWKDAWSDGPRGYTAYTFFEDGTGLMFDKGNGAERFTYTYNAQTRIVSIEYSEYDKEDMTVSSITSSSLIMDGDEYKKTELTYDMLILGEWYLHVGGINTDGIAGKGSRVVFTADWDIEGTGTYEAKDYYNYDATDEWNSSFSGLSGKVSGTWSINNNKRTVTDCW